MQLPAQPSIDCWYRDDILSWLHCTIVSTQQQMQNYNFDQCGVDTALFSAYAVMRESGCCDTVVIDATVTDAYVAAAAIS